MQFATTNKRYVNRWGTATAMLAVLVFLGKPAVVRAADDNSNNTLEKITSELKATGEVYGSAYNSHNVDGLMNFIGDESVIVDWKGNPHQGKAAIRTFFTKAFQDNPNLKLSNTLLSAQLVSPDAVMTFGELKFSGNKPGWPTASRFAVLWKKVDRKWITLFDAGFVPMAASAGK